MDCALWLNRRKVYSAKEIRENIDAASLFGYFAAGSLVEWLREHGGADYADKLERLSPDAPDIIGKIAAVFDGKSVGYKTLGGADKGALGAVSGGGQCSFRGKIGSAGALSALKNGSFGVGSGAFGSFWKSGAFGGSFWRGSFAFGSGFYEWEWEWERLFGSFSKGSFTFGSGYAAWLALLKKYGSFGSFGFGSFGMGSFGPFSFDLFGEVKNGSFIGRKLPDFLANLDEYDRIMLISLYGCPLNQFGYGIHNI